MSRCVYVGGVGRVVAICCIQQPSVCICASLYQSEPDLSPHKGCLCSRWQQMSVFGFGCLCGALFGALVCPRSAV